MELNSEFLELKKELKEELLEVLTPKIMQVIDAIHNSNAIVERKIEDKYNELDKRVSVIEAKVTPN
jgi:hypothetical protein